MRKAAGINAVNYPPATTDVIMVQGDATTMVIRLPPKTVLQASEQNLLKGDSLSYAHLSTIPCTLNRAAPFRAPIRQYHPTTQES